ncbi:MAG: SufD family Fe-S cluster assembly protein [Candidatus Paceibacterota bacterium]|jgi:Fe-S cluster assembly protein SufD
MEISDEYKKQNAFKYGLKMSSPFADEFLKIAESGVESIEVKAGTTETLENDLSKSRLLVVRVREGASFEYIETCSGKANIKNDIHVVLEGAGAKASIIGRYDMTDDSKLDVYHKVYHEAPGTISRIDARGVLSGRSHLIYRSDIMMEKGMKDLSGAEDGKFLVLSKEAKVDAIPSLDIASNSVACSHSLSITHITPEDLFYSKTRGIGEDDARRLLVEGFLTI